MLVIGVDPGLDGALVLLGPRAVLAVADMPTEPGPSGRRRVSAPLLLHQLREWLEVKGWGGHPDGPPVVALESVSAMPGQGVSSMFSLGRSLGVVEASVSTFGLETRFYAASSWKRRLGLLGRPKDASRTRALELYPSAAPWLLRKKDHGRADALLLAHLRLHP